MFTSAGGGFSLPMSGSPTEILIMLLLLLGILWLGFRLLSS
jgi:hypothetical protein